MSVITATEQTPAFLEGYRAGYHHTRRAHDNPYWLYAGCGRDRYDANQDWEAGYEIGRADYQLHTNSLQ